MRASPSVAAAVLLIAGWVAACGGPQAPEVAIEFSHQALLEQADRMAIYFYPGATCADARVTPRTAPPVGPFAVRLDEDGRKRGLSIDFDAIPEGTYAVLVDAHNAVGAIIGTGCAEGRRVIDREISKIRVTIEAPGG